MAEINSQQADYNFRALFVRDPGGVYLAMVNVKITDPATKQVLLETTTSGPVLLARLQPGTYIVDASTSTDGKSITKNITIGRSGNKTTFRFPPEA